MFKRILLGICSLPFIGLGLISFPAGALPLGVGAFILYKAFTGLKAGQTGSSGSNTQDDDAFDTTSRDDDDCVNPATGLPMIGGIGGLDCDGNGYGFGDDD